MNTLNKIVTSSLVGLTLMSFAQAKPRLPHVQPPRELVEVSSEFSEGTQTNLSHKDIEVFLPWAQNAERTLKKALSDIKTLPISEQIRHLDNVMKFVVRQSVTKNYQTFMRFSLNRALLLVQELQRFASTSELGISENILDIQIRSINVAISFFESDLAFQKRTHAGNNTVELSYAKFGLTFAHEMTTATNSVFNAPAQYRLLYKIYEILNWDLSRDSEALNYSEQIVEFYNTLNLLDSENPSNSERDNLNKIRKLSVLQATHKEAADTYSRLETKE